MPRSKNKILYKHIGSRIKNRREELHLSQENVAEKLNVDYRQIYFYESGRSKIHIDYLLKLCELFQVDINYFIGNIKKEKESNSCITNFSTDPELEKRIAVLKEVYALEDDYLKTGINTCIDSINAMLKKLKNDSRNPSPAKKKRLASNSK